MGFSIGGTTALVTGANRGIGEAIVDALVAAGATRIYAAARRPEELAPLAARHGAAIVPLRLDITDAAQIAAAAAAAPDVALLVNNAGYAGHMGGPLDDPAWLAAGREEMAVNFFGTFAVTQAFAPVLARRERSAVVNILSIAALTAFPLFAAYSASKAAAHSLTQSSRVLLRAQGTQVVGVYPGPVDTRMAEALPFEKATPADCARAIIAGLEAGEEDIFPDAMSAGMGAAYFAGPKALERQVAAMGD